MQIPVTRLGPPQNLFLTVPHSGEWLPPEAPWLTQLPESVLLTDVDRFVDQLYTPALEALHLPWISTQVHRYAADLNRFPDDIDAQSVQGNSNPAGTHTKGFHWVETTQGVRILKEPILAQTHVELVQKYHDPFHAQIANLVSEIHQLKPGRTVFHLDCHSMPSKGTAAHSDAGSLRAQVVISDCEGTSASSAFKKIVIEAFRDQGLDVAYNNPYKGGRITQRYGKPLAKHETIQIELNRALYMDEQTRQKGAGFKTLSAALTRILETIYPQLEGLDS